jgi:phosphoribosyl-ATP pyrophosphohydrolase
VLILFITPKNSGLKICSDILSDFIVTPKRIILRGEDIPQFIEISDKRIIGITGEDLFKEYNLKYPKTNLGIIERINWNKLSFTSPRLCLLGPKEKIIENLGKELKICINEKYKRIAETFLVKLKSIKKIKFEKIYFKGSTEEIYKQGMVDLVIDIVFSGESAKRYGLKVYEEIFNSQIVIIGKKDYFRCLEEKINFSIKDLYNLIESKKNEIFESNSYTKKLFKEEQLLKEKILEEAEELIESNSREESIWEISDLIYFIIVFMVNNEISFDDVNKELFRRNKRVKSS